MTPFAREQGASRNSTSYRNEQASLDEKENRIVDLFANGKVDATSSKRQQWRVRQERETLFNKLQEAERTADDAWLATAKRVLELRGKTMGRPGNRMGSGSPRGACNPPRGGKREI